MDHWIQIRNTGRKHTPVFFVLSKLLPRTNTFLQVLKNQSMYDPFRVFFAWKRKSYFKYFFLSCKRILVCTAIDKRNFFRNFPPRSSIRKREDFEIKSRAYYHYYGYYKLEQDRNERTPEMSHEKNRDNIRLKPFSFISGIENRFLDRLTLKTGKVLPPPPPLNLHHLQKFKT